MGRRGAVSLIFVLSGAAGLIYEIVWARQLVLVFGNTTQAVSTILTGYFAGMALGSFLGGWLGDRSRSPLRLYGLIELVLVGVVLVTPVLFRLVRGSYSSAYAGLGTTPGAVTGVRLGLSLVALAPATILLGMTLPVLSRALARRREELGGAFGELYAANTLGAILGTALAGLVLIEMIGLTMTLMVGAGCSLIAGVLALLVDLAMPAAVSEPRSPTPDDGPPRAGGDDPDPRTRGLRGLGLGAAFVSGLTSIGYQVLWTRLLASGTGNTTYVFTAIVVVFLLGIGLGAAAFARLSARPPKSVDLLALVQIAVATLAFLSVGVISGGVVELPFGPATLVSVLPTTIAIGLSLPLASSLVDTGDERVGRDVGLLLTANTLGVILGALVVPFGLVPLIGSPRSVIVLCLINAAFGLAVTLRARPAEGPPPRLRGVLAAAAAIGLGLALAAPPSFVADPSVVRIRRAGELFASAEDEIASVQAGRVGGEKHLWVAGTGMTTLTVDTRLMITLPLVARPRADSILIIAFGMGSSYRSALIAGLQVDAVELVPTVPGFFRYYFEDADRFRSDPRGRIVIADGRNYVELTGRKYDIIVADPPPPIESSGAGVLYSREFYAAAAARLRPEGVMMEWIPFGQTMDEFRNHVRTFSTAFPEVVLALGPGGFGVYMLGSDRPMDFGGARVREVLGRPGILADLSGASDSPARTLDRWVELIPALVLASGADVHRFASTGRVITDDHPLPEYFLIRRLTGSGSPPMTGPGLRQLLPGRG